MRRLALVCMLVIVLAVAYRTGGSPTSGTGSLTLQPPSPAPGEPAPSFTHDRLNGATFKLSERGLYVVTFLNTTNVGSNAIEPALSRLAREFSDTSVQFAGIYVGIPPENAESAPYAVINDSNGELSGMYKIKVIPRTFIVRGGEVYAVQDGFDAEETSDALRASLRELVQG